MDYSELIEKAVLAKMHSYSPYSKFRVGAAVLAASGKIYTGTNVENASYGATICAERSAVFNAVSAGERELTAIAITSDLQDEIYPCGICRQVLAEFMKDEGDVIVTKECGDFRIMKLKEFLPYAFRL